MKFFASILVGLALALGVWTAIYWFTPYRSQPVLVRAISDLFVFKEKLMENSQPPRLVIMAGSNALYGLNAKIISEETGVPTVNFAIAAPMLLPYRIVNLKRYLKPGDTVLLALEYEYYGPPGFNFTHAGVILKHDRGYFLSQPLTEQLRWVLSEPFSMAFEELFRTPAEKEADTKKIEKLFQRHLDDHGDYVNYTLDEQTPQNKASIMSSGAIPIYNIMKEENSRGSWALLQEFVTWCRERNITVLATFPSTVYYPQYDEEAYVQGFAKVVEGYRRLGVPTVGTPKDYIWKESDFFDSNYHLHDVTMRVRTRLLISQLRPFLHETP